MKKLYFSIIAVVILAVACGIYFLHGSSDRNGRMVSGGNVYQLGSITAEDATQPSQTETVIQDLDIPWEIAFLPDGSILVTERAGWIRGLRGADFAIPVEEVTHIGEGGLLGMALHPDYATNHWIYLYHTTRTESGVGNIVDRYTLVDNQLSERQMIVDNIPGSSNHNGGRIKFGPDGFLYVATGDAQNDSDAQNTASLAGKILRLRDDGGIPADNPFGNAVYSYGHRNVQGLAWDAENRMWATEHGRSGLLSGYDELNRIERGKNYGWPEIQGDESRPGMETPVINSGPNDTWAPSGAAYRDGKIFFAGLRGQALYEYAIDDNRLMAHFKGEFGRIRNVVVGQDKNLYILTNNTDGRGAPRIGDDKIIKINF